MSEQVVTYELDGEVALIGLNRPKKRNALNRELHKQLHEAVMRAGEEAKCGVLFGHGESFCAGLDLALAAATWKNGVSPRLPFYRTLDFELMARGPIPFVAALHGATVGGGLEAAASAHVRVADETAFFAMPEGQRGIFVGGGGSVRIARLLGVARMSDLMLTGRVLNAQEAERYNLVQYVVPKGEALAKAKALAMIICKNAPLSNFAITNSLPRILDMSYDDGLFVERLVSEYTRSPESMERLRAFLDKTAPRLQVPE
jgi:enoyl-CoA hydratase/carnithine racemase